MATPYIFGVWLLILCTYQVHAQTEPQITKNILPEIKRYGTTGRLNCTVARQNNYKVHWRRIGQDFNRDNAISTDDKVTLEDFNNPIVHLGQRKYDIIKIPHNHDTATYQLVVRRLSKEDAGLYNCLVQITGGSTTQNPSKDGEMVVLIPPSISQLDTTQVVTVREGTNANMTCLASGFPTPNITWVRPNGMTLPTPYDGKFSIKTNQISLRNLKKSDRGVYRCIADNNVRPPDMYDATLYVQFQPHAKAVQTTYGQAQNRMFDVTMECRISGYPAPNLKWWKNNQEIADDDDHVVHVLLSHGQTLSLAEFWYQLTIINVKANDYGDYYCEGTNDLGSHRTKVQLYETSECQGSHCLYLDGGRTAGASTISFRPISMLVFCGLLSIQKTVL